MLLRRIADGACTPFLGAGACATLPRGRELAERWATEHDYPLEDKHDLARVAQYVGVLFDPMFPKEKIRDEFEALMAKPDNAPEFRDPTNPHGVLADLPLPIYITTNYDDFMVEALKDRNRNPRREICRWNATPGLQDLGSPFGDDSYEPSRQEPLVYHLHGHLKVLESLVLTEDDYLDFLVALSQFLATMPSRHKLLPHRIVRALSNSSLMFIGYALADWDFRVLHRGLVGPTSSAQRRVSVTVQLDPKDPDRAGAARDYLDKYFGDMNLQVYWGTAEAFVEELGRRWREYESSRSTRAA
jgi:hypothetical protein